MNLVPDCVSFSAVAPGSQNQFWVPIPATVQDFGVCIFEIGALPTCFYLMFLSSSIGPNSSNNRPGVSPTFCIAIHQLCDLRQDALPC